ncbi:MAG: hypothetical protein ACMG6H_06895 [Acidobacteriota bacterium]
MRIRPMGKPLWDAQRHDEYVRQRDAADERRVDQREGTSVARDIAAAWALLPADERDVLEYLVLSGARACIGHCSDPLLSRLVDRGMLSWPPGVRPVLTDDLVTVFRMAPAVWAALDAHRGELFPPERDQARLIVDAARRYGARLTPIASADAPDPAPSAA